MATLQEHFDNLAYYHSTIKKKFVRLLINELIDPEYLVSDIELIADKSEFLRRFLPIYFDIVDQKFDSIVRTEELFNEFSKRSVAFEVLLRSIFQTVFLKLDNSNISWDYELDIEPIERYIRIHDKIAFNFPTNMEFLDRDNYTKLSDTRFERLKQEFASLLRDKDNKKILSVGLSFCYGDIVLPKTYDIIFDTGDLTRYWEQKTIIKYAFNYRTYFHTDLWRGHHSHCLIEIIGDTPDIFNELPNNDGGMTSHRGIGLCTKYDWQYIKDK